MPSNPFRRKRDPLQQLLDVVDGVRADAAKTAGDIRDHAAKAADALGEAAPDETRKRLPLIGVVLAGVGAIALAVRAKAKAKAKAPGAQPPPPPVNSAAPNAVETAARSTAAPPAAPSPSGAGEEKQEPEDAVTPEPAPTVEQPAEPKAETEESRAAKE